MLQGAGLALADGFKVYFIIKRRTMKFYHTLWNFKESNLSSTIANFVQFSVGASQTILILIVIIFSAIFTEFTSNLACASILFPILDSMVRI